MIIQSCRHFLSLFCFKLPQTYFIPARPDSSRDYTLTTLSKSSEVFADHLDKWILSLRFFKSSACAFSLIKFLSKMKKNLSVRASLHCPNFTKTGLIMRHGDNGFSNHLKEALLGLLAVMKWLCFSGQRCLQKSSSRAKEIAVMAERMSFY